MRKHALIVTSLVLFVSIALPACGEEEEAVPYECTDAIGCVDIAPGEPIKFGATLSLSECSANWGLAERQMLEFALAERENQLLGHPIELQVEDAKCSAEGGRVAALRIAADPQAVAVFGVGSTLSGAASVEVLSEAGLVMASGASFSPALTSMGGEQGANWQPGFFRTVANSGVGLEAAAKFTVEELGVTRAAIVRDTESERQEIVDAFALSMGALGGEAMLFEVDRGQTDMRPVLTAMADAEIGLVFVLLLSSDASLLVQQAPEVEGLEDVVFLGNMPVAIGLFREGAAEAGVGMYFLGTVPEELSQAGAQTLARYEAQYGEAAENLVFPSVVDAVSLVLSAIEMVAVQEEDGTLHIGRQALRDVLYATEDFEGLTGPLNCDEFGDCRTGSYRIMRLDDPAEGLAGLTSNVVYTYTPGQ